jgi:hypothetical protein
MALSTEAVKRLMISTASQSVGNEVASAINSAQAATSFQGVAVVSKILATSTSQVTNFSALQLGDKVLHFPATAGNLSFVVCQNIAATGSVTYTTASGAQVITINGTAVSFSAGGSDSATATAAVAAIAANATAAALVTAAVDGVDPTKVDITAKINGTAGDYTLTVTGTGATASGATLTGGATAGELPVAAVSGDTYVVLRALDLGATNLKF